MTFTIITNLRQGLSKKHALTYKTPAKNVPPCPTSESPNKTDSVMPSEARYALLYNDYENSPCYRIPFGTFTWAMLCPPLFAFLFCVVYSVVFHFATATYTHCHVFNVLPSISAAIGNFSPQREIWQLAVVVQAIPRFYVAVMYMQLHQKKLYARDAYLGNFACVLNVVENLALIILSFFTSSRNYSIHEKAFITFIVMSELYMIVMCVLQSRYRTKDRVSLKWKRRLVVINIGSILLATYFFMRHNSLCEPYVYSLFAFCEYLVVLTNMAFHMTAIFDFRDKDVVVYKYGVSLCER